ncbi:YceD family protein [bacterium]|nr:YceD family protein [bacterium]
MSEQQSTIYLPRVVDPRKLAKKHQLLQGLVSTKDMPRVQALMNPSEAVCDFTVSMHFQVVDHKPVVDGSFEGQLPVDCLRCLQPMLYTLSGSMRLGIVIDEDMIAIMDSTREPWIVPEKMVNLCEAVEDEILLAMPMVVYHDYQCVPVERFTVGDAKDIASLEDKPNPFAALKMLKETNQD